MGDTDGETYTPRPPGNLFATGANRKNVDHREPNIVGGRPIGSRMPDRYERGAWAGELFLMDTIMRRLAERRGPAPAFHLPRTVGGQQRIGRAETSTYTEGGPPACEEIDAVIGQVEGAHVPT